MPTTPPVAATPLISVSVRLRLTLHVACTPPCDETTGRVAIFRTCATVAWLVSVQNSDGGWGGAVDTPSSTEETALAMEALMPIKAAAAACTRGLEWLLDRVESGKFRDPAPLGLYFAKLWYFERLYPIIFATSALARAMEARRNVG